MKKYFLIIIALLSFSIEACVKDDGNYVYKDEQEVMPTEIIGMGTNMNYTATTLEPFTLEIDIKGLKAEDEDKFEYCWTSYPVNGSGRDTLCHTKNCYVEQIRIKPGQHFLSFEMRNKSNGAMKLVYSMLNVSSKLSNGWFVLKDKDNVTDVDLYNLEGQFYPDLLKTINGGSIPGLAKGFSYLAEGYSHEVTNPDGTVEMLKNMKAFFITTTEDMRAYNADDIKLLKTFNDMFLFAPPAVADPQGVIIGMSGLYAINNNKIHYIQRFYENRGQFGFPAQGNYSLYPTICLNGNQSSLVFDEISSSFKGVRFGNMTLSDLSEVPNVRSCNNMNCDVVFLKEQEAYYFLTKKGVAILKDKTTGEYYSAKLDLALTQQGKNPIIDFKTIPTDREILKATTFGNNHVNSVVYFSAGDNRVGSYNIDNQIEKTILTLPADEKISLVRHIFFTNYTTGNLSRFAVLTNKNDKWKLYTFEFEGKTAEIIIPTTITPMAEGEGNAKYVTYVGAGSEGVN